jgi:hypothetical protein
VGAGIRVGAGVGGYAKGSSRTASLPAISSTIARQSVVEVVAGLLQIRRSALS